MTTPNAAMANLSGPTGATLKVTGSMARQVALEFSERQSPLLKFTRAYGSKIE